jgi:hypothetical protein
VSAPFFEQRHYTVQELASHWASSDDTIRRLFADEPDVILIGTPSRRLARKLKRHYYTMKIPQSVAERVYLRLRNKRRRP